MRQTLARLLAELMHNDSSVMLLTGDLGYGVLDDVAERYPNQFLNVGVAEQNMIGVAAGLVQTGHRVICYSIANFASLRCLEQIRNDIIYHQLDVMIIGIGAGLSYGTLGFSHFATEDISCMRALPGLTIYCPATDNDLTSAMNHLGVMKTPRYLRVDREPAKFDSSNINWGFDSWTTLAHGTDVAIVTTGSIADEAMIASTELAKRGVSVRVISAGLLAPVNSHMVAQALHGVKLVVTVEEHVTSGGLGGLVAEVTTSSSERPRLIRLGIEDSYPDHVGTQSYLRESCRLDGASLVTRLSSEFHQR